MAKRELLRHRHSKRTLGIECLERRDLLAVSFEFNYLPGDPVGFNDPELGPSYRIALESAASRLGSWLLHDAVIQMDVKGFEFDGTAIGKAGSVGGIRPAAGGFVHHLIPEKILNGNDNNGAAADGHVDIYFFGPDDVFSYQIDPSQGIADDEIDFQAVIIHEVAHTLGFTSATQATGTDDSGDGISTPGSWSVFDQFVSDVDGNRFIDADPNSPTAFQMDASSWLTHSTGGQGPQAGLFFDGPVAKSVYGGRVPLYSPATFRLESSVAHLDSEGYPNESYLFAPITHLMSHALVDRAVPQEFTLLEKAILTDIGFRVREDVPPVIHAPDGISLEANNPDGYDGPEDPILDFLDLVSVTDQLDPAPTLTKTLPPEYTLGDHPITLTATDLSGNQTILQPTLSIVDTTPPSLNVTPSNLTVEATSHDGFRFTDINFSTQVSDIVDPAPVITNDATEYLKVGQTPVTFSATDFSLNQSSQSVTIVVEDTTPPTFSPPPDLQIASNRIADADLSDPNSLQFLQAFASDIADPDLEFKAVPDLLPIGTSNVLFTAIDDSGNQAHANIMVNVLGPYDFGDAPIEYPVQLSRDGARHQPSDLYLGQSIDFDLDGNTSPDATGDRQDEDGVRFLSTVIVPTTGTNYTSWVIESTQNGFIDAWIDLNQNNDWESPAEKIFDSIPVELGLNLLSLPISEGSLPGETFARVRLSSDGNLDTTGQAANGEVEDYQIPLSPSHHTTSAMIHWIDASGDLSLDQNQIVFSQNQIISFSASADDAGSLSIIGEERDQTLVLAWNLATNPSAPSLHIDGQLGTNTIQWIGDAQEIDLTDQNDLRISGFQVHDLTAPQKQLLIIDQSSVDRLSPSSKKLLIHLATGDQLSVQDQHSWRLSAPRPHHDSWVLPASDLSHSSRELLVTPTSFWNNYLVNSDVNNDGNVSAADALLIINELSARRYSAADTQKVNLISETPNWPNRYYDQNGDQLVSALDALRAINALTRLDLSNPNGEQTWDTLSRHADQRQVTLPRMTSFPYRLDGHVLNSLLFKNYTASTSSNKNPDTPAYPLHSSRIQPIEPASWSSARKWSQIGSQNDSHSDSKIPSRTKATLRSNLDPLDVDELLASKSPWFDSAAELSR